MSLSPYCLHLAALLQRRDRVEDAVAHWHTALALLPNNIDVLQQLAVVLTTSSLSSVRNAGEAVELAQRAVALTGGQEPLFLETLAAGYAQAGRFSEATETAERARALALSQRKTDLADRLWTQIQSYKSHSGEIP